MPTNVDFRFEAGEAVTLRFEPRTGETDISAWALRFRVFDADDPDTVLLTKTLGSGVEFVTDGEDGDFDVLLTESNTGTTLGAGAFPYDAWRTDAGSGTELANGHLIINP